MKVIHYTDIWIRILLFCLENLKEWGAVGDVGVQGRLILKWILVTWNAWAWTGFVSGSGQIAHSCERGMKLRSVIKCREFFDYPRNWYFLKRTLFHAVSYLMMSGLMNSNCEGLGRSGFPCE